MNAPQKQAIHREISYTKGELAQWKYALETRKRGLEPCKYHESQVAYWELRIKRLAEGL